MVRIVGAFFELRAPRGLHQVLSPRRESPRAWHYRAIGSSSLSALSKPCVDANRTSNPCTVIGSWSQDTSILGSIGPLPQ